MYFFNKALKGFFDNISLNAISTGIVTIIFLIFAIYLFLLININLRFKNLTGNINTTIFLKKDTTKEEAESFIKSLKTIKGILHIKLNSKEDNLKDFKNIFHKTDKQLDIPINPFPMSINVKLKNTLIYSKIQTLIDTIKNLPKAQNIISEIDSGSKWIENTLSALNALKQAGIVFLAILISGLFIIVFNTIKLIFFSRHQEIETLKLMGATNFFITFPLILESAIIGILSSTTAIVILYAFWIYLNKEIAKISFLFSGLNYFNLTQIAFFISTGTILVVLSAQIAIFKFLKDIR